MSAMVPAVLERAGEPDHVITMLAPHHFLSANHRSHWREEAARVRAWREAAGWAAKKARLPKLERVHIVCWLGFPDERRRDPANWAPTAKACVDGLVDVGVLVDDDHRHVVGPDMRIGEPHPKPGRLVIGIYDLGAAVPEAVSADG